MPSTPRSNLCSRGEYADPGIAPQKWTERKLLIRMHDEDPAYCTHDGSNIRDVSLSGRESLNMICGRSNL